MLAGEEIALLEDGFLRCWYYSGYCRDCGCFRAMAALAPDGEWCSCPQCGRAHCNCAVIGWGFTRRVLPEYTIMWPALRASALPEDDPIPVPRGDLSLIVAGARGGIRAIAQTLSISTYRAKQLQRRAFAGRRLNGRRNFIFSESKPSQ